LEQIGKYPVSVQGPGCVKTSRQRFSMRSLVKSEIFYGAELPFMNERAPF